MAAESREMPCNACGYECPADELSQCDRCGRDGLCDACIDERDHNCDEEEEE